MISPTASTSREFVIEAFYPNAPRMCATFAGPSRWRGGTHHLSCRPNTLGSRIMLKTLTSHMLALVEVQVFGESGKFNLCNIHLQLSNKLIAD